MQYQKVVSAKFIERPNRFIAYCEVAGQVEKVHVKNTGRCRELLVPSATVYLEESNNPNRKTKYSLIAVQKGDLLINMDSQAPNSVVEEALRSGKVPLEGLEGSLTKIKREVTYGDSRFDFYLEAGMQKAFMEVKGVTLEEDGIVRFPDAPTERGVKHVEELIKAKKAGYEAYILFVVQMEKAQYFTPHEVRHPAFANALREAARQGVKILAYTCKVTPDTLQLQAPLEVKLEV